MYRDVTFKISKLTFTSGVTGCVFIIGGFLGGILDGTPCIISLLPSTN